MKSMQSEINLKVVTKLDIVKIIVWDKEAQNPSTGGGFIAEGRVE